MKGHGSKWVLLFAVVAAGAALRLTLFAPQPIPVRLLSVERGPVEDTVTNSRAGTVKARRRARLSPEIGGAVVDLPYREGDRVEKGAVLLRVDDSLPRSRLELARADLRAAEAQTERACLEAERASRELARMGRLAEEEIVATDLLDSVESASLAAKAQCAATQAGGERAEAAVEVARTELAKTVLHAPFDGIVADLSIELGEWATPSLPAISVPAVVDLLDPLSTYVSAPMDEVDSARIRVGQEVRVTLDPFPGQTFLGRLTRIAPFVLDIREQNRTVEIEVEIDQDLELLPGTSADVEVILDRRDDVLRLPTSTLMDGDRILLLEDGVLVERQVETGLRNWDFCEALSGVAEGDRVVASLDRPDIEPGALAVEADAGEAP